MKRSVIIFASAVCCSAVSFAVATPDENGIVPKYWLKIDGNVENYGSADMTLSSGFDTYLDTKEGSKAGTGNRPYTKSQLENVPNENAWTLVTTLRSVAAENTVLWGYGSKNKNNGLMLVSAGENAVKLVTWSRGTLAQNPLLTANVVGAASKFHTYAVIVSASYKSLQFYVDGEWKGSATISGSPEERQFQFGSVHSGNPGETGDLKNGDQAAHDDFRIYHQTLTPAQLKTISAALVGVELPAPIYRKKFDGNIQDAGLVDIGFTSYSTGYSETKDGLGANDQTAYVDGIALPGNGGAWTMVSTMKASPVDMSLIWSLGRKDSVRGIALVRTGLNATEDKDVVSLYTWDRADNAGLFSMAMLASAEVADATTAFHNYVVVANPSEGTIALYVDGIAATRNNEVSFAGNPSNSAFQFGGIHGGEGLTEFIKATIGTVHDDWQFYHSALTAAEIGALVKEFPVSKIVTYTSEPEEDLLIDDNDIVVFTGNFNYTGSHTISGAGRLVVREGQVTFKHDTTPAVNAMKDFTGTLVVGYKGIVYVSDPISGNYVSDDTPFNPFGPCTFRLTDNGKIDGYKKRNNVSFSGSIECLAGSNVEFKSTTAHSGSGVNISLYGGLFGAGTITMSNNARQIKFYGANNGFSGNVSVVAAGSYGGIVFRSAESGSAAAAWRLEAGNKAVELSHGDYETISFGDLTVESAKEIKINNTENGTIEIGARGGSSVINVPVTNKKTVISKVGSGVLTLGNDFSVLPGSSINVSGGYVTSEASLSCDVRFLAGSSYQIPATVFAARTPVFLVTVADGFVAEGKPALSVEGRDDVGNWRASWRTNGDGSKTLRIGASGLAILIY